MDHSQANHVSLCAGYGGIDLGLRRAVPRLRTIAYSEIEGYACANLVAKIEAGLLDPAPIWTDVKSFPYRQFHGCVHILSGGYPCQPFSAAGKRLGRNDPRHLWPWIADGIALMRPSLCFFENVEGHITLGLRDVLNDLGELGYRTTWGVFSASEVGAPHQRKRVFILAYSGHLFQRRWAQSILSPYAHPADTGEALAHGKFSGLEGLGSDTRKSHEPESWNSGSPRWPAGPGERQQWWEPPRTVGGLENTTGKRGGSQGGDAVHQGREAGGAGSASLPEDTEREVCASVADDQPAGGDGGSGTIVGNSTRREDDGRESGDLDKTSGKGRCGDHAVDGTGEARVFGQTEPPMGGNSDGNPCGMDYAELCVSCDNRTDELRLLGNGVVPATAALAFTTLLKELI